MRRGVPTQLNGFLDFLDPAAALIPGGTQAKDFSDSFIPGASSNSAGLFSRPASPSQPGAMSPSPSFLGGSILGVPVPLVLVGAAGLAYVLLRRK